MILKYEKEEIDVLTSEKSISEVETKAEATYEHKCFHDELPFKPCIRKKLSLLSETKVYK